MSRIIDMNQQLPNTCQLKIVYSDDEYGYKKVNVTYRALISECGQYRYSLSRIWDESKPCILFIMLNPSTADALQDDPTIRRCINFTKSWGFEFKKGWGFGGIYVGNLFAYRSTDPKALSKVPDPVGIDNKHHIKDMYDKCSLTVCAWGNAPKIGYNSLDLINKEQLYCIAHSKDGNPKHPLYLKADLMYEPFKVLI